MRRDGERGQALFETAIFMPVALLVLFALLYLGRYGVLQERAQSAVRQGALVSYESPATYSAANIYATIAANGAPSGLCPSQVVSDTADVLNGVPEAAQGFWKPDGSVNASCSVTTVGFGGASWAAFHIFTVTRSSVTGSVDVPSYVTSVLGAHGAVSASLGYLHTDPPGIIMYCIPSVGSAVAAALNATYTAGGSC
jgi:hypothetical protein